MGVELIRARGDNDGITEDGQRRFECKPLHGLFVREEQLSVRCCFIVQYLFADESLLRGI